MAAFNRSLYPSAGGSGPSRVLTAEISGGAPHPTLSNRELGPYWLGLLPIGGFARPFVLSHYRRRTYRYFPGAAREADLAENLENVWSAAH